MKNFKKMAIGTICAAMILAYSCTKPAPKNNNNNNTGNKNTSAPSLTVLDPAVDTTVGVSTNLTVNIIAIASGSANVDSILGLDGLGHKFRIVAINLAGGGKVSYTKDTLVYDYYQLPATATGSTVSLTYTVWGKGQSNSITRKVKVISVPVFGLWKVTIYDQAQSGNSVFLNTGANPKPLVYSTGDVNGVDTSYRRLVDMCCAHTAGQTDMIFSPGYESDNYSKSFNDSNIFNIYNGWLPSQKRITLFRKIAPKYVVSNTNNNFQTYAQVKAAYTSATTTALPRVQNPFSPNDNYAFLTWDGRYGVFTLNAFSGGAAMTMALESR